MRSLLPFLAVLSIAPPAWAQDPSRGGEDEIVVTGARPRGSVPGDIPPETTFNTEDVRAFGATSIFQILAAVAPRTGSASVRGGGMPIILVNGRRISGFQEIRDLPADVVTRVEVFDEQLAIQYGYSPDQRVVNLVLERRYDARAVEAGGGAAAGDARSTARAEASFTEINEGDRVALGAAYDEASSVSELERGILAPASGADARGVRTLAPASEVWRANASLARALSERVTGNVSLRADISDQRALLGLDNALAVRERDSDTQAVRAAAGLDGAYEGWQWTSTATADFTRQENDTTDTLGQTRNRSDQRLYDLTATANGALLDVPAGLLRGSLRVGMEQREIESFASTAGGDTSADLGRTTPSARATLQVPLTSRRFEFAEALGDIAVNATASWSEPSDFDALTSIGFGGSWSPVRPLRFSLQHETSQAAPSLQQLGDAPLVTPGVTFFDISRGETVTVTRTTGGNPSLLAEDREDTVFNANLTLSPALSLLFSWARNASSDALVALPTALPETEVAFPSRYTRDLSGTLIALDARPINLAQRDIESIRWGVSYSRAIGAQPRTAPPRAQAQAPAPEARQADPERAEQAPAEQSTPEAAASVQRRMGLGGGQTAGAGRFSVSVFHRLRLMDEALLAPGQPPIDLLDRGGLEGGGEPANAIEFEGGVFYRGLGVRFNGGWTEGYAIPVSSGGVLDFSDRWSISARMFLSFDARPSVIAAAPWLRGARLALVVDNLTDSFVEVRDETGATPAAYQEGYRNPLGRVVQLSLRKQW